LELLVNSEFQKGFFLLPFLSANSYPLKQYWLSRLWNSWARTLLTGEVKCSGHIRAGYGILQKVTE